jgi:hypothetical protein
MAREPDSRTDSPASQVPSPGGLDLAIVLLLALVVELALNRLAVPALRPATADPAWWHRNLDRVALFVFYFASVLAVGVLAQRLWWTSHRVDLYPRAMRVLLGVTGASFAVLAILAVVRAPSSEHTFLLQGTFTLALVLVAAAQLTSRGDRRTKLGLVVLATPLVIHFYGPFAVRVLMPEADLSLYPNVPDALQHLPDRVHDWGQWSIVLVALLSPYLLAPRFRAIPFRIAPLVISTFVVLIASIVVRQHYDVGMEVAMRGVGFTLGPDAPQSRIALYLLSLASITWTLVACLVADAPARRQVGVGLGLVVLGGYAFSWPLLYLVGLVGVMVIGEAARVVRGQESGAGAGDASATSGKFRAPPIADDAWQRYVVNVVDALRGVGPGDGGTGDAEADAAAEAAAAVTAQRELGVALTHIVATRRGVPVQLRITRADGAITAVDVECGGAPPAERSPDWTLHARPEGILAIGAHPEPPPTEAPAQRTGDYAFDRRFRVRDRGGLTAALLDDGLRARATALVDGWLAYWEGRALCYRVLPGRGAPLDHPIPVTELAFRGADAPPAVDRLLALLDLLAAMAARVGLDALPPTPSVSAEWETQGDTGDE